MSKSSQSKVLQGEYGGKNMLYHLQTILPLSNISRRGLRIYFLTVALLSFP